MNWSVSTVLNKILAIVDYDPLRFLFINTLDGSQVLYFRDYTTYGVNLNSAFVANTGLKLASCYMTSSTTASSCGFLSYTGPDNNWYLIAIDDMGTAEMYYTTDGGSEGRSVSYGADNKVVYTGIKTADSSPDMYYMTSTFTIDPSASPVL
jgi:hypothetical protein